MCLFEIKALHFAALLHDGGLTGGGKHGSRRRRRWRRTKAGDFWAKRMAA